MPTDDSRIAVLETQVPDLVERLKRVEANTEEIKTTLSKQRGYIAGVLSILTPLWALIVLYAKEIWSALTGS